MSKKAEPALKQDDKHVSWTEEDEKWLQETTKPQLHAVARRYGKTCFQYTMQMGIVSFCFTTLMQGSQRNQQVMGMLNTILRSCNDMAQLAQAQLGIEPAAFAGCKEDVERIGALLDTGAIQPGMRVSKGGIILDS